MLFKSIFIFLCFLPLMNFAADSTIVIAGKNFKRGPLHQLLFGKHYLEVWESPVKVEIFNMDSVHGGLTPTELGGNFQTVSLRLESKAGKQYVLRNIVKDPSRGLPWLLKRQFIINILTEQNTAENPYAAPVIARLEEFAGILHTNPKIVFVPKDSRLGKYADVMGNKLVLFEERPAGDHSSDSSFGNSRDVVSTAHMLKKRYEDNDHMVDERLYVRTRLFDMLISDWGRHEDQWRWAAFKNAKSTLYKPIPRDRDHAFYKFNDGIFPWIFSSGFFQPKFQSFNKKYRNIAGLNLSAEFLDTRMMNSLSLQDWLEISDSLKASLTDENINQAVKIFPPNVYRACGERIIKNLKRRRDILNRVARKYYGQLAKEVQLSGSDKNEKFSVSMDAKNTTVKIYKIKNNGEEQEIFSRVFNKAETKRIVLRGLGGEDRFILQGRSSGIRIIVTGDAGKDSYTDSLQTRDGKRIKLIKDSEDIIAPSPKWKFLKFPNPIAVFDRKGFVSNQVKPRKKRKSN
jgi:hypothetical protein